VWVGASGSEGSIETECGSLRCCADHTTCVRVRMVCRPQDTCACARGVRTMDVCMCSCRAPTKDAHVKGKCVRVVQMAECALVTFYGSHSQAAMLLQLVKNLCGLHD